MIGFIVVFIIFYFIFAGLGRLFRGDPPTVEYYIVYEYEVETETVQVLEHAHEQDREQILGQPLAQSSELPDNVILLDVNRGAK